MPETQEPAVPAGPKGPLRWQVTITCSRPPRRPGYENDTFHFQEDRLREFFLSMHSADDFELTFMTRRVRLRFTHVASSTAQHCYVEGPLRNSLARVNNMAEHAVAVLAVVMDCAYFQIEGSPGPDARLPGPVHVKVEELGVVADA